MATNKKMFALSLSPFNREELIDLALIIGCVLIFRYIYEWIVNDVSYYKASVGGRL